MIFNLLESNKFRKKLALLLCTSIVFNSVFLPVVSYADEITSPQESTGQEQSPTPSEQQSTPPPETTTETQTQSDSPTSTETSAPTSEITTGDAGSQAGSDNTVNYTETTTEGNVTTGGCSVETDLNCNPSTTNDAQVSGETSAESTSGGNGITDAQGNAEIGTGDAVSGSTAGNLLNTNIVEATEEAEISERSEGSSLVEMANSADLQATSSAESTSGQNSIEGSGGTATIDTGASIAQTSQANIINTNILGSNFEFFLIPITTDQNGDIDLNELWKLLQQKIAEQSANLNGASNVYIINTNEASVDLSAYASAISGQNSAVDNAGGATILTGDSIASASIFNLINLNIIGSNFLFGVINIFGSLTGNIVVPSPYRFLEFLAANNLISESEIINQNYASISSNVLANADSGTNSQIDENGQSLETGDSVAYASSTNFANINLLLSSWYFLLLNNFGFWDGTVDSWENPASSNPQQSETATYELDNPNQQTLEAESAGGGNTSVLNQNTVQVNADVTASAISGQNQTLRNLYSLIKTGKSIALANIFNFLNTNIVGSNFFMPIINLFGSWKGNLVFAYPNLQVEMSADREEVSYGDSLNYTVNYSNIGYEEARNVTLNINLPQEASINSTTGPSFSANGNQLKFFVGNVAAHASGSFSFSATIQRPTSYNKSGSIFAKIFASIISPVEAAEHTRELVTTANIATPDPESNMTENNFSVVTYLVDSDNNSSVPTTEESGDPGLNPELETTSSNNTGEFVYPGDLVTFFTTVKNNGLGKALNTFVYQDIMYNGYVVVQNKFELGEIDGGKQKKLTFTVKVPKKATGGVYQSIIYSDAVSTNGAIFSSNDSISEFRVRTKTPAALPEVKVKSNGSVLAADTNTVGGNNSLFNNFLYLLVFVLSGLWYVEYVRRKDAEEELSLYKKPLINKKSSTLVNTLIGRTYLILIKLLREFKKGISALLNLQIRKRFF
ncbi:hypothetical protein A2954_02415 [Candidatus Roizmanbacteria bacterium RIFCSPLOWO2_01_FULL_37_12]|uniref:DUF11 domain-containing protein n=1 Tax=Candidatus Roizmanbacteria bacterium RIFCSPLOWO2_01_FULL_37_12 TaxID=1802056 RepID=A0A1F7IEU9_9BACT|nr:MAG: hypothetical protein A2954_02415 [Candidatus Roizmanbacteria bacterium RIFCSPLOWO2_01_FULL_37_12]